MGSIGTVLSLVVAIIALFFPFNNSPMTPVLPVLPVPSTGVSTAPVQPTGGFTNLSDGQELRIPAPGSPIGARYIVHGRVDNPHSMKVVCIVRDALSNHFVYKAKLDNGHWSADIGLGPGSIDQPRELTLILATATQAASAEISRIRDEDPNKYDLYGIGTQLPVGVTDIATIAINRVE